MQTDNPIVSIDAKKRELIGSLYRAGEVYSKEEIASYDHAFLTLRRALLFHMAFLI